MEQLMNELKNDLELLEKFRRELDADNREQDAFERGLQAQASFPRLTEQQRKPRLLNLAVQHGVRRALRRIR